MQHNVLQLDIVSPEHSVFSGHVHMVEVPGAMGDFGVLPNHAPFMSLLRAGVIRIHTYGEHIKKFFVADGYAEVNESGCTILSEHMEDLEDISRADALEALAEAKAVLAKAVGEADIAKALKLVDQTEALVQSVHA